MAMTLDCEELAAQAPSRGVPEIGHPESGTLLESSARSGRPFVRRNSERAISREAIERVAATLKERESKTLIALWEHWKGHGSFIASAKQIRALSGCGHKAHWAAMNALMAHGLIRRVQSGRSRRAFAKLKGRPRRNCASKWEFIYKPFRVKWAHDPVLGPLPKPIKKALDREQRAARKLKTMSPPGSTQLVELRGSTKHVAPQMAEQNTGTGTLMPA